MTEYKLDWLYETIEEMPYSNWLYKILCFCLGRRKKKLRYADLYLILYGINKNALGEKKAKKKSLDKVIELWELINHRKIDEELI